VNKGLKRAIVVVTLGDPVTAGSCRSEAVESCLILWYNSDNRDHSGWQIKIFF